MPRTRLALVVTLLALLAPLTALVPTGPSTATPAQSRPGAADPRRAERAVDALAVVEELLADRVRGGDLTLALRELAVLRPALPAAQQRRASTYLARPTDKPRNCRDISCYRTRKARRACSTVVCVHWVSRRADGFNGVAPADRDGDGRPNYVEKVLVNMTRIHGTYVRAGYRAPLRDGRRGGNGKPDVYLAQIGDAGYYGYCTTDDRNIGPQREASAYCVLDNDYRKAEFPRHTPIQNMQVTAAHEYFHAVQFGYDIGESSWFMEATATWAEDELYDRVNDNYGYLPYGPIGKPHIPLNTFQNSGVYQYGTWIFIRNVSETYTTQAGGMPEIVREMWEHADAPEVASLTAIDRALADAAPATSLGAQFTEMAFENRTPGRYYQEGDRYPRAPLAQSWTLSATGPSRRAEFSQNHLTSRNFRFTRGAGAVQLDLDLNLADTSRGSRAVAQVFRTSGAVQTHRLELDADGGYGGSPADYLPFDSSVKWVELTVVNSHRSNNGLNQVVRADALP